MVYNLSGFQKASRDLSEIYRVWGLTDLGLGFSSQSGVRKNPLFAGSLRKESQTLTT